MKPRLHYDNYRRAYYLQWDADGDHIGRQEPVFERTREYIESLEAENAKLRELIAKYSAAAKYLCGFSHCDECNLDCASVFGDVPSGWDCARMLLDKKACELGAEADE